MIIVISTGEALSAGGQFGIGGWTPVLALVVDGNRVIQQVVDFTGGNGTKPDVGLFVGADGLVGDIADAVNVRGAAGAGSPGDDAWTAIEAIVADGDRRVKQVVDWVGGSGAKPDVGMYVGSAGYVALASQATDVRGPNGSNSTVGFLNNGYVIDDGDSRERRGVTPVSSITMEDKYSVLAYAKAASHGRLKTFAVAGNAGYDIAEANAVMNTHPPANSTASTGSGSNASGPDIKYGFKDVDFSHADFVFTHLGINHWSDFNFTGPDLITREATNSVQRANIKAYILARIEQYKSRGAKRVVWMTEGPVGPGSVNFNSGDTIERGYIWHLKWFNDTLNELAVTEKILTIFNAQDVIADPANTKWLPRPFLTLTANGTVDLMDMHEGHWLQRLLGEALWKMVKPWINASITPCYPISASDKLSISKDSYNLRNDSLWYGATVPAKIIYGGGTGNTIAVADANISGVMPPEMAVQVNQTGGVMAGNVTVVCKRIDSPAPRNDPTAPLGKAVQIDITANVDIDGSFGVRRYDTGKTINDAIDAGLLLLNEQKAIQPVCYFKAGKPGGVDGAVTDLDVFRYFAGQFRLRASNNQFNTGNFYGPSNNVTDYSALPAGLNRPGQCEIAMIAPAMKIDGVPAASRMQVQSMAAPNTNEYLYYYVVAKLTAGQSIRIIVGNDGLFLKSIRADGLIPDLF